MAVGGSQFFIITWQDERNGTADIYAQRYSSDGIALDSNFQVNDDVGSENQICPSISADHSGNINIAWQDERNGVENGDIYAQRYSSEGTALGSNFKVNDDMGSAGQTDPSISADGSGNFIITWKDVRNGNGDIYAQRYSSDGTALGNNFKVNDDIGSAWQQTPSVSADDSGNFIIAWVDRGNDDIYAQRYSSDGTALGSNFKVNDDQGSTWQYEPSISADGSGNFIITWEDGRDPTAGCDIYTDIYAQRYSSDGIALGSNFKVNDDLDCPVLYEPSISADGSGNFIIVWNDDRNGYNNRDIYAQRYSSDGTALESNFKVNDDQGSSWQYYPSISADGSGNFIITWEDGRSGTTIDIYAQRYSSDGKTFRNNFRVTNTAEETQRYPDVKLCNNLIFNTWQDNRAGGTGYDIWANVLDWYDPDGMNDNELCQIPVTFVLHQNYPNPFNPSTQISFNLPKPEFVTLEIYNTLGQKIETLLNKAMKAGQHEVEFNAQNLSSGIYFYRIEAGEFQDVKKMVLLR